MFFLSKCPPAWLARRVCLKSSHLATLLPKTEMGVNPTISCLSPRHSQVNVARKTSQPWLSPSFSSLVLLSFLYSLTLRALPGGNLLDSEPQISRGCPGLSVWSLAGTLSHSTSAYWPPAQSLEATAPQGWPMGVLPYRNPEQGLAQSGCQPSKWRRKWKNEQVYLFLCRIFQDENKITWSHSRILFWNIWEST